MPPSTPRVPVSPVTTSVPSLVQWQASGLPPASGVDRQGVYCKDWYIETQTLQYAYMRVPLGGVSALNFGLSSLSFDTAIDGTTLLVQFAAFVDATSATYCYETSSFFQPQQFQVDSVQFDGYGISYGTVAEGTFGPAGAVTTFKPYINRREIVHGVDEIYSEARTGTNWGVVTMNSIAQCNEPEDWFYPGMKIGLYIINVKEMLFSNHTTMLSENFCGGRVVRQSGARLSSKPGPYSTSQDTTDDIQEATDTLGYHIFNGHQLRDSNNGNLPSSPYRPNRHFWA